MSNLLQQSEPEQRVELDWWAYYERFKEMHGEPVKYHGRLLFPDGWTYSATDPAGPEWPPPEDQKELRRLLRAYWVHRLRVVSSELRTAGGEAEYLRVLALAKSAPLQQRIMTVDENGQRRSETVPVDGRYGVDRVEWLQSCLDECNDKIKEYANGSGDDER